MTSRPIEHVAHARCRLRPLAPIGSTLRRAIGLLLAGLLPCAAQSFRIESFHLDSQFHPRLSVPTDANSYYRLLNGGEVTNLRIVVALSLSNS